MSNKKLIFIFAHPDDETFASGGTILRYSQRPDCEIILYCATRGEAGRPGTPPLCPQEQLGEVRTQELEEATAVLGIDRLILRDFGDGKLQMFPFERLVADIANILVKEKPNGVITFPPDGISGHPDHQVIQRATAAAVDSLSFSVPLYYVAVPPTENDPPPEWEATHRIEVGPWRKGIMEALSCHRTQHLSIERVFPGVLQGDWPSLRTVEYYRETGKTVDITEKELL
ncbi:N-acetylglucosaminyl deacetylase, LmbE family [Melghirimyces thermohalophilus]|uniref:N-acetylglucosaminyl deacetylase, LmbE family n=1 Tax=Melghirimyces thermohalophilus TaxID=1236220 RepID=A0A1G6LPI6_9BACL|nr:PIG-L family deacetylase [Melghirimyces thermohalophilus]SDC45208.1 N-acetylglucosaminyl deacetylase, LmbE family [Melghirimyces thermohalophilus]